MITKRVTRPLASVLLVAVISLFSGRISMAVGDLNSALPSNAELPGFSGRRVTSRSPNETSLFAIRKADGMGLKIYVYATPSVAKALEIIKSSKEVTQGPGPRRGSPSGRKIGEEVWNFGHAGELPRGSFHLMTRDGRAVVIMRATLPSKGRDENGRAISTQFSVSDLKLFENLAIGRLNKLSKLGLTR